METKSRLFSKDSLTEEILELSMEEQGSLCGGQGTAPQLRAIAFVYSPGSQPNSNLIGV